MNGFRFQFPVLTIGLSVVIGLVFLVHHPTEVLAQGPATATPASAGGVFITVTYADEPFVNVRSGPSTLYDIIGQLAAGDTAPALGVSPGHEWIQISFNGGIGWVYSAFVAVSPGALQIVEPPPTATPLASPTLDPTLAAAFNAAPTATRLPTFTPPPPLVVPSFTQSSSASDGSFSLGWVIIGIGLVGVIGFLLSFLRRS